MASLEDRMLGGGSTEELAHHALLKKYDMNFLQNTSMITIISLGPGGCMQAQDGPKQTGGTLIGAGLGALTGSQIGQGRG